MSQLAENLAAGLEAVRFVKGKMRFGAKSKVKDIWASKGESISCVDTLRADAVKYEDHLRKAYANDQTGVIERQAEYAASAAAHYGCGNCNEQAALAFIYLRDKGVFPIDWVNKQNFLPGYGGHSFDVIGREAGKVKPADWGASAVVCDPHGAETAFPASQFEQYMPGATLHGLLRLDSRSSSSIRVGF